MNKIMGWQKMRSAHGELRGPLNDDDDDRDGK